MDYWIFIALVALGGYFLLLAQRAQADSVPLPSGGTGDLPAAPADSPGLILPAQDTTKVQAIGQAISVAEGYGVPGAIPTLRNNPGDLVSGGVIATFPDPQTGWNRLYNQINIMLAGQSQYYTVDMSWYQIGAIWARDSSGAWARNVATVLGVDPSSTLSDYVSS